MNVSAKEYREMLKTQKAKSKYHSTKTVVDGIKFDSKKEADYFGNLKMLQQAGVVVGIARQPRFPIGAGHEYVADFIVFLPDGTCEVVEVKGMETDTYLLKKSYFEEKYPMLKLRVIK